MPTPQRPLWQQLLRVAAKTVLDAHEEAQAKKKAEEAAARAQAAEPPAPSGPKVKLGALGHLATSKPTEPSIAKRFSLNDDPEYRRAEEMRQLEHKLAMQRIENQRRADRNKIAKMRMGYFDDDDREGGDDTVPCHVCDGRGSYHGRRGHTECGHCYGKGYIKKRRY
ncbi:hypothetical protein [uncultured Litoreibacter sp.]|uniref:hypothetical protein n=1 Tax=uncultured Litoreibacter sp. TaxID=1392394 RepID=UPI002616018F|nr:hypothetical protein [uncultured Litoreibacter sp.]